MSSEDVFRINQRPLSEDARKFIGQFKCKAAELLSILESAEDGNKRYFALFKTALEEAVMWGTKAIT